jgi:hypothetical protein
MLFIDNKYTRWYYNIITAAQSRNLTTRKQAKTLLGCPELHHIIPESFFIARSKKGIPGWVEGDPESKDNKVFLTTKEHFVCHHLLIKMVDGQGKAKMFKALQKMTHSNEFQSRVKITARLYESIKIEAGKAHSQLLTGLMVGKLNPFFGKSHSSETKKRISVANTGRFVGCKRDPISVEQGAAKLRGVEFSDNHKQALKNTWEQTRNDRIGENHAMFGKNHSDKSKEQMRESSAKRWTPEARELHSIKCKNKPPIPKIECPHCLKQADPGNYKQWHGNNCKVLKTINTTL